MKNREVVTKDNYKQIVLRRAIILCWVLLAICFIVKIFGGNFFNIVCENERFIKVCDYIENTFWYYVVSFISYYIINILIWLSVIRETHFKLKQICILSVILLLGYIIKCINSIAGLIVDMCFIFIPFLFKAKWYNILLGFVLDFVFQFVSIIVKDLSLFNFIDENVVISLIFLIDYYIMLVLYYLYSNILKERNMGLFGRWWLHKSLAELEALLPTLKDEDERKACEKRIAKLKEKEEKKVK